MKIIINTFIVVTLQTCTYVTVHVAYQVVVLKLALNACIVGHVYITMLIQSKCCTATVQCSQFLLNVNSWF